MGKILVSASHYDTLCADAKAFLEQEGHEVVFDPSREFPAYSFEELRDILCDIDAAIIGMDIYNEDVFQIAPKLKAVAKFGVGVDNIDSEAAGKHGVKVLNAPGQNSNAVAELTIGFMLDVLRKVIPLHKKMEESKWPRYMGSEIRGKTVGLLGFGAIARLVAEKLQGFGVEILSYDLYPDEKEAERLHVRMTTMEEVIAKSDVVSIHIPATKETYHLFDDAMFGKMKRGAYLINPARGALVDLDALSRAIQGGRIAGAALDAFEAEPLPEDSPIFQCENIVLTPHTGAETYEAYYNVSMCTARDVAAVLAGREPKYWVNKCER